MSGMTPAEQVFCLNLHIRAIKQHRPQWDLDEDFLLRMVDLQTKNLAEARDALEMVDANNAKALRSAKNAVEHFERSVEELNVKIPELRQKIARSVNEVYRYYDLIEAYEKMM